MGLPKLKQMRHLPSSTSHTRTWTHATCQHCSHGAWSMLLSVSAPQQAGSKGADRQYQESIDGTVRWPLLSQQMLCEINYGLHLYSRNILNGHRVCRCLTS